MDAGTGSCEKRNRRDVRPIVLVSCVLKIKQVQTSFSWMTRRARMFASIAPFVCDLIWRALHHGATTYKMLEKHMTPLRYGGADQGWTTH